MNKMNSTLSKSYLSQFFTWISFFLVMSFYLYHMLNTLLVGLIIHFIVVARNIIIIKMIGSVLLEVMTNFVTDTGIGSITKNALKIQ